MTNPGDYVEHDFPGFGVKIYAPSWVKVTFTRLDRDPKYERTQAGFTFRRLVGNLKFETTGTDQFSFDPPARFCTRVSLTTCGRDATVSSWHGGTAASGSRYLSFPATRTTWRSQSPRSLIRRSPGAPEGFSLRRRVRVLVNM